MNDLAKLAKPLPPKFVSTLPATKKRPALDYVSHAVVTEVLLMIVGPFDWRVEPVQGKDGAVIGCIGHLGCTVDGRYVTIGEVGEAEFTRDDQGNYDEGVVLKNSASDALKRAAMRLGLALDLWAHKHGGYFLYDELMKRATPKDTDVKDDGAKDQPREAVAPICECGTKDNANHAAGCSWEPM